jgi:hypothetical protein
MQRAAVMLAAAFTLLALAGAAQASTIRITDRELTYRRFDEGPRGAGAGDVEIAWLALYNRRITARALGHAELLCTVMTGRSRTCTTTYFLPKGKLVVQGVIGSRLLYELPVVGGTGIYAGARGTLFVTARNVSPREEILLFRLQ